MVSAINEKQDFFSRYFLRARSLVVSDLIRVQILVKNQCFQQYFADVLHPKNRNLEKCHASITHKPNFGSSFSCPKNLKTTILSKYILPNFQPLCYFSFTQKYSMHRSAIKLKKFILSRFSSKNSRARFFSKNHLSRFSPFLS